ncbi:MAG: hypothetical protein AABY15_00775 [Nanoarchaeota archaeon]
MTLKIIDDFREKKFISFYKSIRKTDPIDLAYFYVKGATVSERAFIDDALIEATIEYLDIFNKYRKNPHLLDTEVKLRGRFTEPSELEQKTE